MRIIILSILCIVDTIYAQNEDAKRNPLPYFRRRVEELPDDTPVETVTDDSHSNLLSLLVKNVKELFHEFHSDDENKGDSSFHKTSTVTTIEDYTTITPETEDASTTELSLNYFKSTKPVAKEFSSEVPKILTTTKLPIVRQNNWVNIENTNDIMLYENLSLYNAAENLYKPTLSETLERFEVDERVTRTTRRHKFVHENKELYEKSEPLHTVMVTPVTSINSYMLQQSTNYISRNEPNKTCIHCNNILNDNCNDPKHKIVPFVVCERESDLCYTRHTPFGLVDRGCFNINHNVTTYVCSCNLCNYISISEMPYFFSHKKEWIDNVFELSHTRNFRRSIFKDMACLRCEVNTTVKTRAMLGSVNCLEGNIEHLPVQQCNPDEICGVRAKRSDGYIWRGCIKKPLYNYWISLCDHDLCNLDKFIYFYES